MIFVSNWPALPVFVRARRLADEHELRVNAADAEHDIFARRREMRTFDAGQCAFPQGGKRNGFRLRIERRTLAGNGLVRQREQGGLFGGR
jgi:hypothetical protein